MQARIAVTMSGKHYGITPAMAAGLTDRVWELNELIA